MGKNARTLRSFEKDGCPTLAKPLHLTKFIHNNFYLQTNLHRAMPGLSHLALLVLMLSSPSLASLDFNDDCQKALRSPLKKLYIKYSGGIIIVIILLLEFNS